jgi:hypothetical protein
VYFYSLKSALPNFIQKNTAGSAFNVLSDKIYLALNLNMGEALWILSGCACLPRKCLVLLIRTSYDTA